MMQSANNVVMMVRFKIWMLLVSFGFVIISLAGHAPGTTLREGTETFYPFWG